MALATPLLLTSSSLAYIDWVNGELINYSYFAQCFLGLLPDPNYSVSFPQNAATRYGAELFLAALSILAGKAPVFLVEVLSALHKLSAIIAFSVSCEILRKERGMLPVPFITASVGFAFSSILSLNHVLAFLAAQAITGSSILVYLGLLCTQLKARRVQAFLALHLLYILVTYSEALPLMCSLAGLLFIEAAWRHRKAQAVGIACTFCAGLLVNPILALQRVRYLYRLKDVVAGFNVLGDPTQGLLSYLAAGFGFRYQYLEAVTLPDKVLSIAVIVTLALVIIAFITASIRFRTLLFFCISTLLVVMHVHILPIGAPAAPLYYKTYKVLAAVYFYFFFALAVLLDALMRQPLWRGAGMAVPAAAADKAAILVDRISPSPSHFPSRPKMVAAVQGSLRRAHQRHAQQRRVQQRRAHDHSTRSKSEPPNESDRRNVKRERLAAIQAPFIRVTNSVLRLAAVIAAGVFVIGNILVSSQAAAALRNLATVYREADIDRTMAIARANRPGFVVLAHDFNASFWDLLASYKGAPRLLLDRRQAEEVYHIFSFALMEPVVFRQTAGQPSLSSGGNVFEGTIIIPTVAGYYPDPANVDLRGLLGSIAPDLRLNERRTLLSTRAFRVVDAALVLTGNPHAAPDGRENKPPEIVGVNPSSGKGFDAVLDFTYADPNGSRDIVGTLINITSAAAVTYSDCYMSYSRITNQLALMMDGGKTWDASVIGSGRRLANSHCGVDLSRSSTKEDGDRFTLSLAVRFMPSFSGRRLIQTSVADQATVTTGLQSVGWWDVR
jgi:hypothetical protein